MKKQNRTTASRSRKSGTRKRAATSPLARLTTAFAELDEAHRIVLCLHYLEQLTLYQIARVLDDSEETVKRVYLEAIERLGAPAVRVRDAA